MRSRQPCADHELELQIIHETYDELVLRLGDLDKIEAIRKARQMWISNTWAISYYSSIIAIMYLVVFYFYPSLKSNINLNYGLYYAFTIGLPIIIFLYIIYCLYTFYEACFITWLLDKKPQKLTQIKTNLLNKKRQIYFDFAQIKGIYVTQEYDGDSLNFECTELYFVLQSGKEITLSQSSYIIKSESKEKAIAYHQELAEKMRSFIVTT